MAVNPAGGITMVEIATERGISTSSISLDNEETKKN